MVSATGGCSFLLLDASIIGLGRWRCWAVYRCLRHKAFDGTWTNQQWRWSPPIPQSLISDSPLRFLQTLFLAVGESPFVCLFFCSSLICFFFFVIVVIILFLLSFSRWALISSRISAQHPLIYTTNKSIHYWGSISSACDSWNSLSLLLVLDPVVWSLVPLSLPRSTHFAPFICFALVARQLNKTL